MVYSYVIDKDIVGNQTEQQLDLWAERFDSFYNAVHKRCVWLDCDSLGLSNVIHQEFGILISAISDPLLQIKLNELYSSYFYSNCVSVANSCSCTHTSACDLLKTTQALKLVTNTTPHSAIVSEPFSRPLPIEIIKLSSYKSSNVYKEIVKSTSWEGNLTSSLPSMQVIMNSAWASIITVIKDKISLLDRNVFKNWVPDSIIPSSDFNYKKGLTQFYNLIKTYNPNIVFKLVTQYEQINRTIKYHDRQYSIDTSSIISDIQKFLDTLKPIKIEMFLCRSNASIDHDRFILFDDKIGAYINRGLDTFVPNSSFDKYRVTYYKPEEAHSYIRTAERQPNRENNLTIIKNY